MLSSMSRLSSTPYDICVNRASEILVLVVVHILIILQNFLFSCQSGFLISSFCKGSTNVFWKLKLYYFSNNYCAPNYKLLHFLTIIFIKSTLIPVLFSFSVI